MVDDECGDGSAGGMQAQAELLLDRLEEWKGGSLFYEAVGPAS